MTLVCVKKVTYGKDFGRHTVEVGETVESVLVCGTEMYCTNEGRYLAPYLYSEYFKERANEASQDR